MKLAYVVVVMYVRISGGKKRKWERNSRREGGGRSVAEILFRFSLLRMCMEGRKGGVLRDCCAHLTRYPNDLPRIVLLFSWIFPHIELSNCMKNLVGIPSFFLFLFLSPFLPLPSLRLMLRYTLVFLKARINGFSPWKQRPSGLVRNSAPQMVHGGHFRGKYRQENPDDPTRTTKIKHVILKRCPVCKRTLFVKLEDVDQFHMCCEGATMKVCGNMQSVMNAEHKLLVHTRQWDVESDRPWCNPHRPRPKGRSKLKKK